MTSSMEIQARCSNRSCRGQGHKDKIGVELNVSLVKERTIYESIKTLVILIISKRVMYLENSTIHDIVLAQDHRVPGRNPRIA